MSQEKSTSTFQIILMVVFGLAIVIGVMVFAGFIKIGGKSSSAVTGNVEIWGTIPSSSISPFIDSFEAVHKDLTIRYVTKDPSTFNTNLTEALASGKGPDIVFVNQDLLLKNISRIFTIPYASFPQRTIEDNYTREASLLLTQSGVLGVPVSLDPLVLYYNRDIFDNAGIAQPPKTWEEVADLVPKLTIINPDNHAIMQSAIALGSYGNILNAKDILSMFLLQSGATIVDKRKDFYQCTLRESAGDVNSPMESAIDYYMQFSDQTNKKYTWNNGLANSHDMFISGKLAMYIGFASELFSLQEQNPNFSYDVAYIPQFKDSTASVTFANMLGAAIMKSSKNFTPSYTVLTALAGEDFETTLSKNLSLPPPRRSLLSIAPENAYAQIFYNSALISRGWLDPSPDRSDSVMIGLYRLNSLLLLDVV